MAEKKYGQSKTIKMKSIYKKEELEEFIKKIGFTEGEDGRWYRDIARETKQELAGRIYQEVINLDEMLTNEKDLASFIRRNSKRLPK